MSSGHSGAELCFVLVLNQLLCELGCSLPQQVNLAAQGGGFFSLHVHFFFCSHHEHV